MMEREKKIFEIITNIYIFILIVCFPLIVDSTGFFHILECKWYAHLNIAIFYFLIIIAIYFYFLIFKKINYFNYVRLSKIQIFAIIFLIINIVSCYISPFFNKYNLFIGVGRGEGLINCTLYVLSFLFITIFGKFNKKQLLYFSISSIILNTISVLQYIGFNPLNMYQNNIGTHNVSFMGTIGNVDFISAIYCILLTISISSFIFLNEKKQYKIIHLISVLLGFFILGIIDVDSGKLAFFSILIIVFPFIVLENERLSRFLIIVSTILLAYCINVILNPIYYYSLKRLVFEWQFNYIVILFLLVIILLMILFVYIRTIKYNYLKERKLYVAYYLLLCFLFIVAILGLYIFDFNFEILHQIHDMLHGNFNDEYGTYRIFLWKRTIKLIPEYPILGSGPDTFALRFMPKYSKDIMSIGEYTINDTAANVYLTMLINIGIVGLTSYMLFIASNIYYGLKNKSEYSVILLITIICFLIQDFFNLSVVIVTPIFWCLLAIHYNCIKTN